MILLGIDVGGSSIKAGLADIERGEMASELLVVPTPQPSTPEPVMREVGEIARRFPGSSGPVGFAFPSVVKDGRACTAANVDHAWLGAPGAELASQAVGRPALFLNDADAAGLAEMRWGAGKNTSGTVIMLTFGTGIGSAIFRDGVLVPNTEFGHLEMRGGEAEHWAAARVKTELGLSWQEWTARVNDYLDAMHRLFWPDVFIIGGAVSQEYERFAPLLRSRAEIRPAHFAGQAGVMGAALAAAEHFLRR